MVNPIPPHVRSIWEHWNIRGAILFSLLLQAQLILIAPLRKRTTRKFVMFLVWSSYLLADATATFAVGLISNSQDNGSLAKTSNCTQFNHLDGLRNKTSDSNNSDLLAFWAPFLLLHLGGPDTITAFALEDNELWLRHFLAFVVQALATGYVFVQTLPTNKLAIPTFLLFFAGIIKYLERTRALYLASVDRFRDSLIKEPDPGPNYAKLMEEYATKKDSKLPTQIIMIPEPDKEIKDPDAPPKELNEFDIIQEAFRLFNNFRGLLVDLIFSFKERDESRDFFASISSMDALKIIEAELNFIYDVLFTKVIVIHSVWGYRFRFLSVTSVLIALAVFRFYVKKHDFNKLDIGITYALLFVALALEMIAIIMAFLSDWTIVAVRTVDPFPDQGWWPAVQSFLATRLEPFFKKFLKMKETLWVPCEKETFTVHNLMRTFIVYRRWSGFLKCHNLIRYCLKGRPRRIHKFHTRLSRIISWILHLCTCSNHKANQNQQVDVNCKQLQVRSQNVVDETQNVNNSSQSKTDEASCLGNAWNVSTHLLGVVWDKGTELTGLKDFFDEIIYVYPEPFTKEMWQFIFNEIKTKSQFADDPETARRISAARGDWVLQDTDLDNLDFIRRDGTDREDKAAIDSFRRNLMAYVIDVSYDESILLWHVATELLYQTDEENAENYVDREFSKILSDYMMYLVLMQPTLMASVAGSGKIRFRDTCAETVRFFKSKGLRANQDKQACEAILKVDTDVKPITVKGDRSKSVLFDASMLAKELRNLKERKWRLFSRMWVEMMSYAASNCRASGHAQQVRKGGEFLTVVWLLMAHFGLGKQFQINEGHARAKLIVGK